MTDGAPLSDPRMTQEAAATVERIQQGVREEVAAGAPAWAGAYSMGDGTGVNVSLDLAPKAGFAFEWHGCLGLYDRNWGAVEELEDGSLRLLPELPNVREGFRGIATILVPVRWGARRYLLEPDEIEEFLADVEKGFEPRDHHWGMYLMGVGDEELPAEGRPQLPPAFRPDAPRAPEDLSPVGRRAFDILLHAERFSDDAVGVAGITPLEVHALRHLVREEHAAEALRRLLAEATTAGRLFALCGLWYADPPTFRREVERWARSDETVPYLRGCILDPERRVADLVRSSAEHVVRLTGPEDSVRAWVDRAGGGEPYALDIAGGGLPNELVEAGGWHEPQLAPLPPRKGR